MKWRDKMKEELREVDWRREMEDKSGCESWTIFRDKVQSVVDKSVPERRMKNNNRPNWLSNKILRWRRNGGV